MNYAKIIADNVRTLLENEKMSVTQLADQIGVPQTTLNAQLNSQKGLPLNVVMSISDYFGIDVPTLCGKQKSPAPESEADAGEKELVNNYRSMNAAGRESLVRLSGDMVASGRYATDKPHIAYIAAEGSGPEKIKITDEVKKAFDELETDI